MTGSWPAPPAHTAPPPRPGPSASPVRRRSGPSSAHPRGVGGRDRRECARRPVPARRGPRRDLGHLSGDFRGAEGQRVRRQLQLVEFRGQLDHRFVATRAHIGDDGGDRVIDIDRLFALGRQQRGEGRLEIGRGDASGKQAWFVLFGFVLGRAARRVAIGRVTSDSTTSTHSTDSLIAPSPAKTSVISPVPSAPGAKSAASSDSTAPASVGSTPLARHRQHVMDHQQAAHALVIARFLGAGAVFPPEAVQQQREAAAPGVIGHVGAGQDRVLHQRRDHAQILGIKRGQPDRAVSAPSSKRASSVMCRTPVRPSRRRRPAFLPPAHSRDPGGRRARRWFRLRRPMRPGSATPTRADRSP